LRAVADASRKFYEDKIETFFQTGRFLQETFDERSSIFSLKELLESFVQRARELRRHTSGVFTKIGGVPPTSHFHVPTEYETLLATLELNFFLTKYFEMTDRDGRKVAVFALNAGLCEKYDITFGRPTGEREFRLYFIERIFDYSPQIIHYLKNNQEIVCEGCGARYEHGDLDKLRFFNMRCPKCNAGTCRVTNLSRKYAAELEAVNLELLLPKTELGILQTLDAGQARMRAGEIAEELDCSHQLIGRRGKHLEERKLVVRDVDEDGRRTYELTSFAKDSYFDTRFAADLRILPEAEDKDKKT
jgi:DNA-binding HxlR family transcriptional regulator